MSERGGRRNPPNDSRFKPGKSGNPRGRPKGRKNFRTIMLEEFNKLISVRQSNGRMVKKTKLALMMEQTINDGLRGEPRAREQVVKLALGLGDATDAQVADGATPDDGLVPDTETLRLIAKRLAYLRDDDGGS